MATLQPFLRLRLARDAARLFHSSALHRQHYINPSIHDFDRIVLNGTRDRVVLVDFHAEWCGPCHQLSPILRKLTTERTTPSGSQLDLVTIDVDGDEGSELSQKYSVRALPTVVAFRGGQILDQFVGALNEGGVTKFLDKF